MAKKIEAEAPLPAQAEVPGPDLVPPDTGDQEFVTRLGEDVRSYAVLVREVYQAAHAAAANTVRKHLLQQAERRGPLSCLRLENK